jgi:GT2 family glycosyltransferase
VSIVGRRGGDLPVVSVVFLAYNRRDQLLRALDQMLSHCGYPENRLEVLVVDNASDDGTAEAVSDAFPSVRLVRNEQNIGAPGWNAGFRVAHGKYVLILDDDAYVRPGDLERAVCAAEAERAGLVSFSVVSSFEDPRRFNDDFQTGLLSYWGCAALISREALSSLGGYDPQIFIWANEVELTIRLLDRGFRHLHLPNVHAVHMKKRPVGWNRHAYLVNARHHAYVAAKLLRPVDLVAVELNLVQQAVVDALLKDPFVITSVREVLVGCFAGLRRRAPVRPVVSSAYRRNFHAFAGPWPFTRSLRERLAARRDRAIVTTQRRTRNARWYSERARYYPTEPASLQL